MVESGSIDLLYNIASRDALASRRSGHSATDEDRVKGRNQAPSEGEHALDATRSRWPQPPVYGPTRNPDEPVFFTGDLTQTGSVAEFDGLKRLLESLWKELSHHGIEPVLCPVPGNHDLKRPERLDAATKLLAQSWGSDSDLRAEFWRDAGCEYREKVRQHSSAYEKFFFFDEGCLLLRNAVA